MNKKEILITISIPICLFLINRIFLGGQITDSCNGDTYCWMFTLFFCLPVTIIGILVMVAETI